MFFTDKQHIANLTCAAERLDFEWYSIYNV